MLVRVWHLQTQILVDNDYRVSTAVAKKYRTLANNCSDKVDEAWHELENEWGEGQPIKSSYVVGKRDFNKLEESDMLECISEFVSMYRSNRGQCSGSSMFTYLIFLV